MNIKISTILFILYANFNYAQPNCEAFNYYGDKKQYEACNLIKGANSYNQLSKEFQQIYDEALEICPYFAYAYREKSVAYLKTGDFINWKKLIDLAVKYDEIGNLDYRAWCKFQFFRDYKGAIQDFERLEKLTSDIGYSQNGHYHLQIVKGICYSALGENQKAVKIIINQLKKDNYLVGPYDYFQLGVIYFKLNDLENALLFFDKQTEYNQLAENYYFVARIYKLKKMQQEFEINKSLAIENYKNKRYLFDPYTHHYNKIFLSEIVSENFL